MWYVIQTMVGNELKIKEQIDAKIPQDICSECFYIRYENIWKKSGSSNISVEVLFPGYLFIDTDSPVELYEVLKDIAGFTSVLSDRDEKKKTFLKINSKEQELLENLINGDSEHIVRVSYVRRNKDKRIDYAKGPLENYIDNIVSVDYHHRRAFIEVPFLDTIRRIKMGIIVDEDIEKEKGSRKTNTQKEIPQIDKWDWKSRQSAQIKQSEAEVTQINDIKAGDWIYDNSEIYVDSIMRVKRVIPNKNALVVEVKMFGTTIDLQLDASSVQKVEVDG